MSREADDEAEVEARLGTFDTGRVHAEVRKVFAAIGLRLAVIVGVLVVAPQVAAGVLLPWVGAMVAPDESLWPVAWGLDFVAFVFIACGFWLAQAAVAFAAGTWIEGDPAPLGEVFATIFDNASALLMQGVIAFTWIGLMTLFLIVPGAMAMSAWLVGLPVHVMEDAAPLAAYRRSERLTVGSRPAAFGLVVMVVVPTAAAVVVAGWAVRWLLFSNPYLAIAVEAVLCAGIIAAAVAVGSVMMTAIYYELRRVKEGFGRLQVAEVFD